MSDLILMILQKRIDPVSVQNRGRITEKKRIACVLHCGERFIGGGSVSERGNLKKHASRCFHKPRVNQNEK
jgi:hypothetical protein